MTNSLFNIQQIIGTALKLYLSLAFPYLRSNQGVMGLRFLHLLKWIEFLSQ